MSRVERAASWLGWGAVGWLPVAGVCAYVTPLRVLYDRPWQHVPSTALDWAMGYAQADPVVHRWLPLVAAAATVACLAPAVSALTAPAGSWRTELKPRRGKPGAAPPSPVRANSSLHGDADWLGEREMRRLAARPLPEWGGVIYGAALRPDLHPDDDGGAAPLLVSTGESEAPNGLVYGGQGSGKTSGVFVPTLVHPRGWKGNVLVNDPTGQLVALCSRALKAEGRHVLRVGAGLRGFNLFAGLVPTSPHFEAECHTAVEVMGRPVQAGGRSDANAVFAEMARNMVVAQLADFTADPAIPAADKTPRRLMTQLTVPQDELRGRLEYIHRDSPSPLARMMAAPLWNAHQRSFDSYYGDVMADLKWLTIASNADLVSDTAPGAPTVEDFVDGDACLFLNLDVPTMKAYPQLGRCILGAILRRITREQRRLPRPLLLLLEERVLFGDLEPLNVAWTQSRKWGVVIVEAWQSLAIMRKTVNEAMAETMQNGVAFESYAAIKAKTAAEVSDRLGKYTALAPSESTGTNTGGHGSGGGNRSTNITTSLQAVPLMTRDRLEGLPSGWQVVFVNGVGHPVLCRQARYYLRPELADVVPQDHYVAVPAAA